jgi:hypothetical protein
MALIERLCQVDPDEPGGEPKERHIAIHDWIAAQTMVLAGVHTVAQVKTFYAMTAEDEAEYDTIIGLITDHNQIYNRMLAVRHMEAVLHFHERRHDVTTPYNTVAGVRTELLNDL